MTKYTWIDREDHEIKYWNDSGCGVMPVAKLVRAMAEDGVPSSVAKKLVGVVHAAVSSSISIRSRWDIPKGGRLPLRVSRDIRRLRLVAVQATNLAKAMADCSGIYARHHYLRKKKRGVFASIR